MSATERHGGLCGSRAQPALTLRPGTGTRDRDKTQGQDTGTRGRDKTQARHCRLPGPPRSVHVGEEVASEPEREGDKVCDGGGDGMCV